jgi:hypothetical protein
VEGTSDKITADDKKINRKYATPTLHINGMLL